MNLTKQTKYELATFIVDRKYAPLDKECADKLRRSTVRYILKHLGEEVIKSTVSQKGTLFVGPLNHAHVPFTRENGRSSSTYVEFKAPLTVPGALLVGGYSDSLEVTKAISSSRRGSPRYYAEKQLTLDRERRDIYQDVLLKLTGFRTHKQLKEQWPEIIPDLKALLESKGKHLPMIVDNTKLNDLLGLPPKK